MCGILFTNRPDIAEPDFEAALRLMRHRGPDATGCARHDVWGTQQRGAVQLGHNRLSIVDLNARSDQPFYSRDRRHAIVFNGEIYNYRELARQYGIALATGCDTELL